MNIQLPSFDCINIRQTDQEFTHHNYDQKQTSNIYPADENTITNTPVNYFQPSQWNINKFEIGKYLGGGKFGKVYLAREKQNKFLLAIKQIKQVQLQIHNLEHTFWREVEINSYVNHPNILQMFGYFQDHENYYLMLELAPYGEMFDLLKKQPNKRFNEQQAANYIKQVSLAIEHLHSKNIIHRDLKPENILIFENDTIKISDFGWSAHSPSNSRETQCGTPDYLCPEIYSGQPYNNSVDIWTIGVLAYELVTGKVPFNGSNHLSRKQKILSCNISFPNYVTDLFKNFVTSILVKDPLKRPSISQLLEHPWIN